MRTNHPKTYNPLYHLDQLHKECGFTHAFDPDTMTTPGQVKQWQKRARRAVRSALGLDLFKPADAFNPTVEHHVERPDHWRKKVIIHTSPHTQMPVYLLLPKDLKPGESRPTVLAFHGHGYGVKDIVGLWEDGEERFEPHGYHKDFAVELVRQGFVVAAPELYGFGERRTPQDAQWPLGASSCIAASNYASMLGTTVIGFRIHDVLQLINWLETEMPEANTARLGVMGISGGGMQATFSTALDSRIKACVISGYFCTWRQSILAGNHCQCNFIPGIYQLVDLPDVAGLIAPRPCLVEAAERDSVFPIQHVKKTITRSRKIWRTLNAAEHLTADYFDGRHEISGRKSFDFLTDVLMT